MKQSALYPFIGSVGYDVNLLSEVFRKAGAAFHPNRVALDVIGSHALIATFFLAFSLMAPDGSLRASEAPDTVQIEELATRKGPIIQRIVVEPQNVFGPDETANSRLLRTLNRVHIPTRNSVVIRESLLKVGDVYDPDLAFETERNLRGLASIYEASVVFDTLNPKGNTLYLRTIDRWSLSAGLKVLRRSERNLFQFGLTESNFLGLGHRIGATYTISKPDPSYLKLEYRNPRVMGSFNEFALNVVNNPLDRSSRVTVRRRFLHQSDEVSYRLSYLSFDRRDINVTSVGDTAVTYFQEGNRVEGSFSIRRGDFHHKITASAIYRYISGDIRDLTVFNGYSLDGIGRIVPPTTQSPLDTFIIPADSALHELTFSGSATLTDFYALKRIKYQGRVEDLTIVNGIGLSFGQGRDKSFGSRLYSIWGAGINYGAIVSNFIFAGGTSRTGWVQDGREFRSVLRSSVIAYHNGLSWVTFASRAFFSYDRRREDPNPLSVDGSSGVRGYPANFLTGNKLLVGNLESRFFTGVSALTAQLGFALHFDYGVAWGDGDKLGLQRFIWSAGPGLRIDLGQVGTVRVDVSYLRALDSWEISAATGQFFDLNPGK